jgi:hypothetical protein
MIDLLLGPLGSILAVLGAAVLAFLYGRWDGSTSTRERINANADRAYRETRLDIDKTDLGLGSTDDERIKRLLAIADRNSSGSTRRD